MVVAGTVGSAGTPWPRVQLTLGGRRARSSAVAGAAASRAAVRSELADGDECGLPVHRCGARPPHGYRPVGGWTPPLWASADVDVSAGDITGVELALRPPIRVSGRVRFEGTAAAPADLTRPRVALGRVTAGIPDAIGFRPAMFQALPAGAASIDADGGFTLPAVHPGVFMISAGVPGDTPWRLQSMLGGRDLLDDPLVVPPDRRDDITGVVLTFGDRRTAIAGTLQTTSGMPTPEYFIVVFTTERRWWRPDGRRLAFVRPATDGQFVIGDLPPGRYYYIAALTDLDAAGWQTPDFLDRVVPGALSLDLKSGETRRQDLQIAGAR